jgi:hypothetical protein
MFSGKHVRRLPCKQSFSVEGGMSRPSTSAISLFARFRMTVCEVLNPEYSMLDIKAAEKRKKAAKMPMRYFGPHKTCALTSIST